MPLRKNQYARRQLDRPGDRGDVSEWDQRVRKRNVIAARHLSIFGAGGWRVVDRNCDVLDAPQRFKTASFGGSRQMSQQAGIAECSGRGKADTEFHARPPVSNYYSSADQIRNSSA